MALRGEGDRSIADSIGFVGAPFSAVRSELLAWRQRLGRFPVPVEMASATQAIAALSPRRLPWSREALLECDDDRWTAYLSDGADPWPATSFLAQQLDAQAVVAVHSADSSHASTQLQLLGPQGAPPLLYVRTLAAHCEDGRWSWHADGEPQPFEEPSRYESRRIRDRLDRPLLLQYLSALGLDLDGPGFLGSAVIVAPFGR